MTSESRTMIWDNDMGATRRIVTFNWLTADGYFAASDGNLDWVVPDEAQAKAAADSIPNFDTVLFGRRTSSTSPARFRTPIILDDDLRNMVP
jgi:hypothetical protein